MIREAKAGDGWGKARGRNGWFGPDEVETYSYGMAGSAGTGHFRVYSRRAGDEAPVVLTFTGAAAARRAGRMLLKLADDMVRDARASKKRSGGAVK